MVVTCKLMGGLGNQLFQIFATISYAMTVHSKFEFTNEEVLTTGAHRPTYWTSMLARLRPFTVPPEKHAQLPLVREPGFTHSPLPLSQDAMLFGYFQSYKYFETHYAIICKLLGIAVLKENMKVLNGSVPFEQTVSMHFRLGDYKHIQHCHPIQTIHYYQHALAHILERSNDITYVLYFCEDEDVEIVQASIVALQETWPYLTFQRANSRLADWEQLVCMSCCRHNIIANSSFSWWGAYFNDHADKMVCYPSTWFGHAMKHDTRDLCPTEWRKITNLL